MMIKRSLIFFALFSACWLCKAQYDISLEVKNSLSDTMYIGYFHLGQTYAFDTCVNAKGKYRFKSKVKSMPAGMYFFSDNTGRYVEFLIDKERKLSFKTDYSDLAANISVKGSEDGKVYYEYIKETNRLGKEFKSLSSRTQNKEEYTEKLNELRLQNEELKENFVEQHSEHLLSKILMASRPVSFPQVQTKYNQDGSVDSLAMRQENYFNYKQHYFDNVDLTCDALMRTPKEVFANMYSNYWENVMKYEKADSLIYYTEKLISRTKEGGDMYKYIINDVTKRSLTDNIMGHDKVYVYMVEQYFETGKVTWMHPSDIEMNVQRAKKWKNLLIGKTVPNLACPEDDDKSPWHSLNDLETRYKILVFWSVECGHCTKEMPQLAEFYKNNKEKYDLGIFAVHTEGDLGQMRDFAQKFEMNWTNTNGLYANYDWHDYFDVEKTPIIYILDSENKILAKNVSVETISQIMEMLEKGLFDL